jgi:hypothetical protein
LRRNGIQRFARGRVWRLHYIPAEYQSP